jgi:hypothetical protein
MLLQPKLVLEAMHDRLDPMPTFDALDRAPYPSVTALP